ncbi:uncharacterized protein LOC132613047 [Lycium barbarum]|uniref:uncharacterized protein LOC132613047 n=1 Tax=Lycium barbarum TaxID=112863 RepID=UPI00293EEF06|nr:uncharacterized protein LOC132613047 [Lycium barbarum]
MKRDIVDFVSWCLKYEHQKPSGVIQRIPIPKWKWERIAMDFLVGFPRTLGKFDAIWVIVDSLTKSAHFIPKELGTRVELSTTFHPQKDGQSKWTIQVRPLGTDLLRDSLDKVKLIQGRFLTAQSRQKHYANQKHIGEVAYELALPLNLSGGHPVFHVSVLMKYLSDGSHVILWASVLLNQNLTFEEEPIAILDRQVRKFKSKEITLVKVQWMHRPVE